MERRPVVEYGLRRVLIVAGVMCAALLQTLDATIVNVALPTIEGNLGASIEEATWVITAYIISNVVAIPLVPFFITRMGRREYFATCVIGFTVASALCGSATSLETLIAWRVVQGAFGGGLVATSQIILRDTFPPDKVGASAALFAIALTVGPALGPTLGGILTDAFSWNWVFEINIVPGALSALIVLTLLRNPVERMRIPFDGFGFALLAAGLGAFQYLLDEGERRDWFADESIVVAAVVAVAAIAAFIVRELRVRAPLVDLSVFRHRNLQVGAPIALFFGLAIFAPTIILPQFVSSQLGFTSTLSGELIFMRALPVLLLTPLVARLAGSGRTDLRILLTLGFVLNGGFVVLLSYVTTSTTDFAHLALPMFLSGLGQSLFLVPLLVAVQSTIPVAESPRASPFISLSVQLGGSISSALVVTLLDRRIDFHYAVLASGATLRNVAVARLAGAPHAANLLAGQIQRQAAVIGFADAFWFVGALTVTALPLVWMLVRRRPQPAAPATAAAPVYGMPRTTPPSTRSAAPVVAAAAGEHT